MIDSVRQEAGRYSKDQLEARIVGGTSPYQTVSVVSRANDVVDTLRESERLSD